MKKQLLCAAVAVAGLMTSNAFAQAAEGPWMVRVRAVHLDSVNKDSTGLGLSVNNKTMPELDISYFLSPNVAVELILTVPQKHELSSFGRQIGTLKHLPPTLLAQYHFTGNSGFKPYVGAGINYTRFSSVDVLGGVADIDRNSFGAALQVGVDIPLSGNMYLNFDVKKVYLGTDVTVAGVDAGSFKVNPLLVGVGLGWRF
jgi:outer membrane protein